MTDKLKVVIIAFGGALFAVLLALVVWSFFRPAVKDGPWPPTQLARDAGRG